MKRTILFFIGSCLSLFYSMNAHALASPGCWGGGEYHAYFCIDIIAQEPQIHERGPYSSPEDLVRIIKNFAAWLIA